MRYINSAVVQTTRSNRNQQRPRISPVFGLAFALASALSLPGCGSVESSAAPNLPAAPASATSTAPAAAGDVRSMLTLANSAFHANRIVAPAGDNALEHAVRALLRDGNSAGAHEILADIAPLAASTVEANIASRDFAEAERVVALLAKANPSSLTVKSLRRRIAVAANRAAVTGVAASVSEG